MGGQADCGVVVFVGLYSSIIRIFELGVASHKSYPAETSQRRSGSPSIDKARLGNLRYSKSEIVSQNGHLKMDVCLQSCSERFVGVGFCCVTVSGRCRGCGCAHWQHIQPRQQCIRRQAANLGGVAQVCRFLKKARFVEASRFGIAGLAVPGQDSRSAQKTGAKLAHAVCAPPSPAPFLARIMADFKTHITASTVVGMGLGGVAYTQFGLPLDQCLLAAGLCSVSGMLPDLDSDTGVPLRESLSFAAAVIPMLLMDRFRSMGMSLDSMVLATAGIYLFVRFVFGKALRAYTVHRGMFHSIPAVIIFAEVAFLICGSDDLQRRLFLSAAVTIGVLTHLLLDEIYSVNVKRLRIKKSFGTAMKLFSNRLWPNISAYGKLAILTWLVIQDPIWQEDKNSPVNQGLHVDREDEETPEDATDFLGTLFGRDRNSPSADDSGLAGTTNAARRE